MTPNCFGAATISSDFFTQFSTPNFFWERAPRFPAVLVLPQPLNSASAICIDVQTHANPCMTLCDNDCTSLYLYFCVCALMQFHTCARSSSSLASGLLITRDSADNFCSISLIYAPPLPSKRCCSLHGKVKVFVHIFPSSQNSFHSITIKQKYKLNFFFHSKTVKC